MTVEAWACRPAANFIAPDLSINFTKAVHVFHGKILSKKTLGRSTNPFGMKFEIEFEVEKNLKGTKEKTLKLLSYSNTCDLFGQDVVAGSDCVIFADQNKTIISGFLSGESSVCASSPTTDSSQILKQRLEAISKF